MDYKEYIHDARRGEELERTLSNYESIVKAIPEIKEVIKKFDKKMYNKKLNDELYNVFGHEKTGYSIGCHKNCYNKDLIEMYYYHHGSETLLTMRTDQLEDGKRIDAAVWNAKLDEKRNYYAKKIDEIKACLPKVLEYKNQLEQLQKAALTIYNAIPSELHEAFYVRRPNFYY
jgi:hypothetical protein